MELSIFLKSLVRIFDIYSDSNIPDNVNMVIDQIRPWNLEVTNYDVKEVREGYLIEARIPFSNANTQGFELPGMPGFFVSFNQEPGHNFIYIRIIVPFDRNDQYLILRDLRLNFRYGNSTVLSDGISGITISVQADIKVDNQFKFEFQSFNADCDQRLRLFNNDIFLRCRGFRFNFDEETEMIPFNALPENGRKGIFCRRVELGLGEDNIFNIDRNISFAFRELYITTNGISFKFHQHIFADILNNDFDPRTEFLCNIIRRMPAAVTGVRGRVENNSLEYFGIDGILRLPLLGIFARFSLNFNIADSRVNATLNSIIPIDRTLGLLHIIIGEFELSGVLGNDTASLSGTARNIRIQLNPIDIALVQAGFHIESSEEKDEIGFEIDPLPIPLFGFLREAALTLYQHKTGDTPEDEINISGKLRWADIKNRLSVNLPMLSDDDEVEVEIIYKKDPDTDDYFVEVKLKVGLADPSAAWSFLPANFRPQVRNAQTEFTLRYDSADAFADADESSPLNVIAGFSFECRLPDIMEIPPNPIFTLIAGGDDGWMRVSMNIATDLNNISTASLSILDPVTLGINFPGLPQPEPPISISLDAISFTTGQDAAATLRLEVTGSFRFLPLTLPRGFVISEHIEKLLGNFTSASEVAGTVKLSIGIKDENSEIKIECKFSNLGFEADIFDLIADLSKGLPTTPGVREPSNEVDLDIPVSFGLKGFSITFGSLEQGHADNFQFSVDFNFAFLDISSTVSFALSDQECRMGFKALSIPLRFPKFPLSNAEINRASWDVVVNNFDRDVQFVELLLTSLGGLSEAISTRVDIADCILIFNAFYVEYNLTPLPQAVKDRVEVHASEVNGQGAAIGYERLATATDAIQKILQRHSGEIKLKHALVVTATSIRNRLADDPARDNFHNLLSGLLTITDAVNTIFYADTDLRLLINATLVVPFNDPRNIAIEGGAMLTGAQPGDPLHSLNNTELGLGLSTERIYFFAKSTGAPIPIRVGSYEVGYVSFTHFTIGYGFTKNSFSTSFGGTFDPSSRLQNDTDSSDNIGVGFRLPSHTSLAFRFDIIIPPPPAPIPVPYLEFDLDMQRPGLVTVADPTICAPNWDGFQFIFENVFRVGFKRIAFSPFFGPLPILNYRYAYDLSIGDKNNGVTIICDNFLVMWGLGTPPNSIPIPFFIEPGSPYYDNLCVHVQLAGFELNFHLQRPLPKFHPLAIFEILGLLSDPMMRIDPEGPLANIVKISLTDSYIRVPDWVTFLAPSLKEINKKEVNIVLNLGTVISAFQQCFRLLQDIQQILEDADHSMRLKIDQLVNFMEEPDLSKLLSLVPPDLRKLRAEANFGGFMGKVVLVIVDADNTQFLKDAFRAREDGVPDPVANDYRLANIGDTATDAEKEKYKVNSPTARGHRSFDPIRDLGQLFRGMEFAHFTEADIDAFPSGHREELTGIVAGATLRVFNQRYRFLGSIFDDGSFAMITAVEIEPLRLSISGIRVNLGLSIIARLTLLGRRERNRYYAKITGESYAEWEPIPGILLVVLGDRKSKTPVRIAVDGKGRFEVKGAAYVSIFNGAAEIQGHIDAKNDHCFVEGTFTYAPPISIDGKQLIFLQMVTTTKIGPGDKFLLAGSADLKILEQPVINVNARISDEGGSLAFHFDTGNWRIGPFVFPLLVRTDFRGDIRIRQPGFSFEGNGILIIRRPGTTRQLFRMNGAMLLGYSGSRGAYLMASGMVRWYGLNWIGGGIEFSSDRMRIFGDTKFVVNITPEGFGGLTFAAVVLQFEMNGFLEVNEDGEINLEVKGKWLVGISGAGENSVFPIASQELDISASIDGGPVTLIDIPNLEFIPGQDLQVPVPATTNITIYAMRVNLGFATYRFLFPTDLGGAASEWAKIPIIDPTDWKMVSLQDLLLNASVKVDLELANWRPQLRVKIGNRTHVIRL